MMKPIVIPQEQTDTPTEGCWRVPGHCFDACPAGQKTADGKTHPDWAKNRGRLFMTGTIFGKIQENDHPLKGDGSWEGVLKELVFNDRENFSQFVLNLFKMGNECEPIAAEMFEKSSGAEMDYPGLLISEKVPHVGGSPDGVARDRSFIIEIKTACKRKIVFDDAGVARVPRKYLGQANFYMWLMNIRACRFLQYDRDSGQLYETELAYDDEAMASGLARMYAFIDEVVKYRQAWRATMAGLREAVDFLDRGILVPVNPAQRNEECYTRIGTRMDKTHERLGAGLAAARGIIGEIDTYKPRAPPKKRKREAIRESEEVEAAAGLSGEEVAKIQKTLKE